MSESIIALPPVYKPSGTHQRKNNLSSVQTITLAPTEHAIYVQALTQNVRMTIDGTAPVASGNDTGFQLRAGDPAVRLDLAPGTTLKFIQEAATAILQYQLLTVWTRYGN